MLNGDLHFMLHTNILYHEPFLRKSVGRKISVQVTIATYFITKKKFWKDLIMSIFLQMVMPINNFTI
jgi:hypothetical protein